MADDHSLAERLLEAAVYVPVGLAASFLDEFPALADKGRERVGNQLQVARVVGRLAVAEGRRRLHATGPSDTSGAGGDDVESEVRPKRPPRPAPPAPETPRGGAGERLPSPPPAPPSEVPSAASLPIPGYDTLAASQVVQRLSSLRPDELDAVRRYEVATRGRRTILHRIGQLTTADGPTSG